MRCKMPVLALAAITTLISSAAAQSPPKSDQNERGMTSYVEFGGTYDSDGQAYELNSNVGYDFTKHFGVVVGAPVYFMQPSSSTAGSSSSGIGNPYLNLHVKYPGALLKFNSSLTGTAPLGDSKKGLSTGRATGDWTSRLEHEFSDLTPFAEVGFANTVADTRLFVRPYTTLGFNTHIQAGADYDIWKIFSIGASGYDILPSGQQTIFSRVSNGKGNNGTVHHGRVFELNQQTTGGASIAHDDGFSAWIDANPGRALDLELGFTRSMAYDLNSVGFSIGVNVGQLYRRSGK